MQYDMMHPADQIVTIMERIYGYGMTTTSGGNLSILDDNGDIWITPGGVDKGSLTRKDIICVQKDGTIVGPHKPSSEYPFHKSVYEIRKDVRAVLHAHPPALVAFSIVRKIPNTRLMPKADQECGNVGMAPYDLPGSLKLGQKIALEFQKGYDLVMLENHGIVVAGSNLFEAFRSFETLDFSARIEIKAHRIGSPLILAEEKLEKNESYMGSTLSEFEPLSRSNEELDARREMCSLIQRAYNQRLFTSTQGTFSRRLSDNSFLITPYDVDRKYIEPTDLVRIYHHQREAGKTPSRSVILHEAIYRKHPHINAVIIAHAPNIMAFAVTEAVFDSRTIPESYILLRGVPKLPFGSATMQPELAADIFQPDTPVVLVENDCVIVAGDSLLNAFDRLEVVEYSAKGIIASKELGEMVKINDEQVIEINDAFRLP